MTDFDLSAFYGQFRDEAWDNLDLLEQGLTQLEAQPGDTALLDRMLRAIHTTKGSAKIMGFTAINRLAHEIEEVLGMVRQGKTKLTSEVGNSLLQASAGIRAQADALVEGRETTVDVAGLLASLQKITGVPEPVPEAALKEAEAAAAPVVTVSAGPSRPRETMRVDLRRVDLLARLVGEALSLQQQALAEQQTLRDLTLAQEESHRILAGLKDHLESYRDRFRRYQAEEVFKRLSWLENALQQLQEQWRDFHREHNALLEHFSLTLDELHQEALSIRMLPIGSLFERFPGVVRRIAGECGVEVTLEVRGVEVELDRRVLDLLRDPLIHLMRNALAHGIEPPEERERLGKSRRGRIVLDARQQGRRVQIVVQDDGRGIDMERVRRTAMERGLLDEERDRESDDRMLLDLLFLPGFSTRRRATDMSGRGVGLDVVQTAMRQLNGLVQVETQANQGTTFTLDVPLTLATMRVLLVETAGETLAIPSAAIRNLVRVRPQEIISVEGWPTLQWQERTLRLLALADVVGFPTEAARTGPRPAVITGTDGYQVALVVDRVIDEAEVVVRSLGAILGQSPYFSGATLLGTDRVIPILDLGGLLTSAPSSPRTAEAQPRPAAMLREPLAILLVEDAITTRELERSILEAAGYRVEIAFDGVDALQKMEQDDFHLVVTDIEMPRMDGFELTDRLRHDARWTDLPVIIITAWEDEEKRRRGLQVGAQAYIVKSRFDQSNLLETITQLIG